MEQIINSLLETDLYKFSMGQAIYHQFPGYVTTWTFKCRNTDVRFTDDMVEEIRAQIKAYCDLKFTEEELEYMDRSVPNLVGLPLNVAEQLLEDQGLTWRVIGDGSSVTIQMPAANSVVAAKSQIVLFADAAPSEDLEEVPDLTYLPYDIARQRLGYLALFINTDSHTVLDSQSVVVARQSIEPGEKVEHGTVVRVTLTDTDTSTNGRY